MSCCTAASFKWLWINEWTVHSFMVLETTWMVCQLIELLIIIITCECNRFYYGLLFLAMTFHYTKNQMLLELQYKLCQRTDRHGNRINGNELNCVAIRFVATNQIAWQMILLPWHHSRGNTTYRNATDHCINHLSQRRRVWQLIVLPRPWTLWQNPIVMLGNEPLRLQ